MHKHNHIVFIIFILQVTTIISSDNSGRPSIKTQVDLITQKKAERLKEAESAVKKLDMHSALSHNDRQQSSKLANHPSEQRTATSTSPTSSHLSDINWPIDKDSYTDTWEIEAEKHPGIPLPFLDPRDHNPPLMPANKRPKTFIQWINQQVGHGLVAQEEIPLATPIAPYTGKVEKHNDAEEGGPNQNPYILSISPDYCIDGTKSTEARFANHSFNPNAMYTFFKDPKSGMNQLWITAVKRIKHGEEVRCDYSPRYWFNLKIMPTESPSNGRIAMLTNTSHLQEYNLMAYADNQPESELPLVDGEPCTSQLTLIYNKNQFEIALLKKVYPGMALIQTDNKVIMVLITGRIMRQPDNILDRATKEESAVRRIAIAMTPIAIEIQAGQQPTIIDNQVFEEDAYIRAAYNQLRERINPRAAEKYFK